MSIASTPRRASALAVAASAALSLPATAAAQPIQDPPTVRLTADQVRAREPGDGPALTIPLAGGALALVVAGGGYLALRRPRLRPVPPRPRQDVSAMKARALPLLAVITVAGLLAAHLVRAGDPAAMARRTSEPEQVPTGWHARDVAAVTWLREIIATQTASASVTLARCEPAAAAKYLACSKPPLAQLGTSGAMNSAILTRIADQTGPPAPCDALIRSLAGSQANVAMLARDALRGELGNASHGRVAAHGVRTLARYSRRLARAPGWRSHCRPESV